LFEYNFWQRFGLGQSCYISRFGTGGKGCRGDKSQTIVPGGTCASARHRELGDAQQLRAAGHIKANCTSSARLQKVEGKRGVMTTLLCLAWKKLAPPSGGEA
jgi:hypothetical protein